MSTENKDKNYVEPKKEDTAKNALKSKSSCFGQVAIAGSHYQSGTVTAACSCGSVGPTKVESAWNMKAYLCCYYYGAYFWCHQIVKGKDFTLKDGVHSCSSCSKNLGNYEAC